MKKNLLKRSVSTMLALMLCMVFTISATAPVEAAPKADMKKANVKWDLKKNKKVKFKTKWYAVGTKTHTVKMTNYKVTKADKPGFKKCTFTLTYRLKINPTKAQVNKMGNRYVKHGTFGGSYYWTVNDYKTGRCLAGTNDKGVTVTSTGWKYSKFKKIKGTRGAWISYARKAQTSVTIIYPENYKDLVIGVGGFHTYSTNVQSFFNGNKAFSKEKKLYHKKDKGYAHFMRVK